MGFATVFAQIIFIFILIFSLVAFANIVNTYMIKTDSAMNGAQEIQKNHLKCNIEINYANYSSQDEISTIHVKNSGSIVLDQNLIDLYYDGFRIPRNETNRTVSIIESTNLINPKLWDSEEEIQANISGHKDSGNHRIDVVSEYDCKASRIISI